MKSLRLQRAGLYTKGFNCLGDCGTDHGKLPIYCVEQGFVKKAYASDNKKGPFENAVKNIQDKGLQNSIIPLLADGLVYLNDEIDVVSILGMGGRMIASILKRADLSHVKRLILSANSENFLLRDFLEQAEWRIIAEELIKENGKFYQLLILEKGQMNLSNIEKEFGPFIIKEKSENFKEMIKLLLKKLIVAKVEAKSDSAKKKIETRIKELEGVLM